jgi:hypothetical protein
MIRFWSSDCLGSADEVSIFLLSSAFNLWISPNECAIYGFIIALQCAVSAADQPQQISLSEHLHGSILSCVVKLNL